MYFYNVLHFESLIMQHMIKRYMGAMQTLMLLFPVPFFFQQFQNNYLIKAKQADHYENNPSC